jgi:hypothetical protein
MDAWAAVAQWDIGVVNSDASVGACNQHGGNGTTTAQLSPQVRITS